MQNEFSNSDTSARTFVLDTLFYPDGLISISTFEFNTKSICLISWFEYICFLIGLKQNSLTSDWLLLWSRYPQYGSFQDSRTVYLNLSNLSIIVQLGAVLKASLNLLILLILDDPFRYAWSLQVCLITTGMLDHYRFSFGLFDLFR